MFRSIETGTWDDPKVKELPAEGKLLFIYLFSNRHTHVCGLYYLPNPIILMELGGQKDKICRYPIDTLWHTISEAELAWRDEKRQIVFVKNMFRYQGQGEKHYRSAAAHIKTLHRTDLINRFIEVYPKIKNYGIDISPDTLADRVSIGYPDLGPRTRNQEPGTRNTSICMGTEKNSVPLSASKSTSQIFEFWKSHSSLFQHRFLSKTDQQHLKVALKNFSTEEIKTAITRYAKVLENQNGRYWLSAKWTIGDFVSRKGSKWITAFNSEDWEMQMLGEAARKNLPKLDTVGMPRSHTGPLDPDYAKLVASKADELFGPIEDEET